MSPEHSAGSCSASDRRGHPQGRGRDAGCPTPPAQIRACPLRHTAPTSGMTAGRDARRIRPPPVSRKPRLCVRSVFWWAEFPLVPPLRSTDSAESSPSLFARFSTTMGESDCFLSPLMGYGFLLSHKAPALAGGEQALPGPDTRRTCVLGFLDTAVPDCPSPSRSSRCCLRPHPRPRHLRSRRFRCSIAPPTRAATDASPTPSRMPTHGSRRNVDG